MAEIRNRVRERMAKLSYQYANLVDDKDIDNHWKSLILTGSNERWLDCADQILSIKELAEGLEAVEKGWNAKVDRDANLPQILVDPALSKVDNVRACKETIRNDGWVKEVK